MRSFDPKDVNVIFGGVVLTGLAENTFVAAERMEDTFTEYIGAKGEVAMAETSNEAGEVTITLEQTSPSVRYLNNMAMKKGNSAVAPIQIVDLNNGTTIISGTEARVRKPAPYEAGKEISEREFVIFVAKLEID